MTTTWYMYLLIDIGHISSGTRSSIPSCCHWWWSCCCCHCSGSFYVDNVVQSESSESPGPEQANASSGKVVLKDFLRKAFKFPPCFLDLVQNFSILASLDCFEAIFYSKLCWQSCKSRVLSVVTEPLQMRLLKGEEMNSVLRRRLWLQRANCYHHLISLLFRSEARGHSQPEYLRKPT